MATTVVVAINVNDVNDDNDDGGNSKVSASCVSVSNDVNGCYHHHY